MIFYAKFYLGNPRNSDNEPSSISHFLGSDVSFSSSSVAIASAFSSMARYRKKAEFLERRVNDVKPHMNNLHSWLLEKKQKEMLLDSSKTKEAVNYCLNRWENLENFIKYPEATFSTNAALIETAKQNGIAPEDYLRCLFEKAP